MLQKPLESLTNKAHQELISRSLHFAEQIQSQSQATISTQEKNFYHKMQHIIESPEHKALFIELLDSSVHTDDTLHNFELLSNILHRYNFGDFFTTKEKILLSLFLRFGQYAPNISVPLFINQIRKDSRLMVLFSHHIDSLPKNTLKRNYYFITKPALSTKAVAENIQRTQERLDSSSISHISIKGSAFYTQLWQGDYQFLCDELTRNLTALFTHALQKQKEQNLPKVITLDMEEHRFYWLHLHAFMRALESFSELEAGITIQAYIPESFTHLQTLVNYSKKRVESNAKPIYIRLVKGANMQAQRLYAAEHNWHLPTYSSKLDTDALFKQLLHFIITNKHYQHITLGIASHNTFELAYAYTLLQECVEEPYRERFIFEMSMGMSMQTSKILSTYHSVMIYTPVCDEARFKDAITYLLRRLDENTDTENFMRHYYGMRIGDEKWEYHKQKFLDSLQHIAHISHNPLNTQTLATQVGTQDHTQTPLTQKPQNTHVREQMDSTQTHKSQSKPTAPACENPENLRQSFRALLESSFEPDTDFLLQANYQWLRETLQSTFSQTTSQTESNTKSATTQSRTTPDNSLDTTAQTLLMDRQALRCTLNTLKTTPASPLCEPERMRLVCENAIGLLRARKREIITQAQAENGKNAIATDMEINELITLLRFYPNALATILQRCPSVRFNPKGIGLVISSALSHIGLGFSAVIAALVCGNRVVLKPSSKVVQSSLIICECLWSAGIERDVLYFVPAKSQDFCDEIAQSSIEFVFCSFFGTKRNVRSLLQAKPTLPLSAQTHTLNTMIISKLADYDEALRHIISSAFFHTGHNAISLAIIDESILDRFMNALQESADSLQVGTAQEPRNAINTTHISAELSQTLTQLGIELDSTKDSMGDSALDSINHQNSNHTIYMRPRIHLIDYTAILQNIDNLVSNPIHQSLAPNTSSPNSLQSPMRPPVRSIAESHPSSPVLFVLSARDVKNAIKLANSLGDRHICALESLDEQEWAYFCKNARASTLIINHPTTHTASANAIQAPFGKTATECNFGRKVGSKNYLLQFLHLTQEQEEICLSQSIIEHKFKRVIEENTTPKTTQALRNALLKAKSYVYYRENEFSLHLDYSLGYGKKYMLFYEPIAHLGYRVSENDTLEDVLSVILGAQACKAKILVSFPNACENLRFLRENLTHLGLIAELAQEDTTSFSAKIASFDRIRYHATPSPDDLIYQTAATYGKPIIRATPISNGRCELLWYYNEKLIAIAHHRYGIFAENKLAKLLD